MCKCMYIGIKLYNANKLLENHICFYLTFSNVLRSDWPVSMQSNDKVDKLYRNPYSLDITRILKEI